MTNPVVTAYAWAGGLIEIGTACPDGALTIATAARDVLTPIIEVTSRHSYDGKALLVPGVPEAADGGAAFEIDHAVPLWFGGADDDDGNTYPRDAPATGTETPDYGQSL